MRLLRASLALFAVSGFLVPAPDATAEVAIERVPAGIVRLLADQGRAWERHEAPLLRRTLDARIRGRELRALAASSDVPFRDYDLRATTLYSGNLASPRVRRRYPRLEAATYHVLIRTALDVERVPYLDDGAFTFVREGPDDADPYDGWRLAATDDLAILGFSAPQAMWDGGKVAVLRSRHFVLLAHPDAAEEMRPLLAVAEDAYGVAASFWPLRHEERYVIVVPTTTEELARIVRSPIDFGKFVAVVVASVDRGSGWRATGPRLFVHLDHLRTYGRAEQRLIVAHELIHARTRASSGPHVPAWIEEGLASAGSGAQADRALAEEGTAPTTFPSDDQFTSGPVRDIQRRYAQAQIAIDVLEREKGKAGLVRFYEALGRARVVPGSDSYHVRHAVETALRWPVDDWVTAWRKALG